MTKAVQTPERTKPATLAHQPMALPAHWNWVNTQSLLGHMIRVSCSIQTTVQHLLGVKHVFDPHICIYDLTGIISDGQIMPYCHLYKWIPSSSLGTSGFCHVGNGEPSDLCYSCGKCRSLWPYSLGPCNCPVICLILQHRRIRCTEGDGVSPRHRLHPSTILISW